MTLSSCATELSGIPGTSPRQPQTPPPQEPYAPVDQQSISQRLTWPRMQSTEYPSWIRHGGAQGFKQLVHAGSLVPLLTGPSFHHLAVSLRGLNLPDSEQHAMWGPMCHQGTGASRQLIYVDATNRTPATA